ncbi:Galactosylceramide sulfotransferase [Holothuria leucospilota]|uniref:Galactosylceramide sulfotransferase n=1 Tax=Holothuria leucospilota TaxID=206669 RepID=A0A9Q1HAQ1_HOLLE|nr:Galactosylceramide sulfotransferase [Holothuria leucospilota]
MAYSSSFFVKKIGFILFMLVCLLLLQVSFHLTDVSRNIGLDCKSNCSVLPFPRAKSWNSFSTESVPPCSHGNIDSVVLVKTHKTASSTIGSIIGRYGVERNLTFALPRNSNSMFGDVPFRSTMLLSSPSNGGFHLLISHVPFNRTTVQDVMKPEVKYITILRDPVAQFYSGVHFFKLNDFFNISKDIYAQNFDIKAFLRRISECETYACRVIYNGQMFDLGLLTNTFSDMSMASIEDKIQKIEKDLDLVLIQEYFDESLLLFKKLMCWEFKDIVYLSQKVQDTHVSPPNKHAGIIRAWNYVDALLFDHFNKSLWIKINQYGPSFQSDLKYFRHLNKNTTALCHKRTEQALTRVRVQKSRHRSHRKKSADQRPDKTNELCANLERDVFGYVKMLRAREMSEQMKV